MIYINFVLFAFAALAYISWGGFLLLTLAWCQDDIQKDKLPYVDSRIEMFVVIALGGHGKSAEIQKLWSRGIWHKLFYVLTILMYSPIYILDWIISLFRRLHK